jgi:hypothetical protein
MTCPADRHDTDDAYVNARCRCPEARADHAKARHRRRKRRAFYGPQRVDSTASALRLQALAVMGWGCDEIAAVTGLERSVVGRLRDRFHATTTLRLHNVAAMAYRDLIGQRGPAHRTALYAERRGWTLLDYQFDGDLTNDFLNPVDWVAVERVCDGEDTLRLNRSERQAAYDLIRRRGHSHSEAARRLNLSGSSATVYRDRYEERKVVSA